MKPSQRDYIESAKPLLDDHMDTDSVIISSSPPLTATDLNDHSEHNGPPPAYSINSPSPPAQATTTNTAAADNANPTSTTNTRPPLIPMGYKSPPQMTLLGSAPPRTQSQTPKSAATPLAVNCCGHTDNFTQACGVLDCCGSGSHVTRSCCGINACASESLLEQACCGLNLCGSQSLLLTTACCGVNCCGSRSGLERACCGVNCCGSGSKLASSVMVVDLCGSSSSRLVGKTICAVQCCEPREGDGGEWEDS